MTDPESDSVHIDIPVPEPEAAAVPGVIGPTVVVTPPADSGPSPEVLIKVGELEARVAALEAKPEEPEVLLAPSPEEIFDEPLEELSDDVGDLAEILEDAEFPDLPSDEELVEEGMPSELREAAAATALRAEEAGEVAAEEAESTAALVEGTLPQGPPRREHWSTGSFPFRR